MREYIIKISDEIMEGEDFDEGGPPELIRCKDCKFHGNLDPNYCVELEQITSDEFYCGYGKPRH